MIEKVQKYFTRRLFKKDFSYNERLFILDLESLEVRRIKTDLLMCYKIIHGLVDLNPNNFFVFAKKRTSRGHNFRLVKRVFSNSSLSNCFSNRVVNCWNALSSDIVESSTITSFKNKWRRVDMAPFCLG